MSVSTLAMIVFFACFAIAHFTTAGAVVTLIGAIAAVVAAIALALGK